MKKIIILISFSLCSLTFLNAQSIEELYDQTAQYVNEGKFKEAIILSETILVKAESEYGRKNENYQAIATQFASLYQRVAGYYYDQELYTDAIFLFEKASLLHIEIEDKPSIDYLICLEGLGSSHLSLENYEKSLDYFLELHKIYNSNNNAKNDAYIDLLNTLGMLYWHFNEYEKALPFYLEKVDISKEIFSKQHDYYSSALINLANLYSDMKKYDKTITVYLELLEIFEIKLGKKHLDYSLILNDLALTYSYIGNYEKAEPLHIEAIDIMEKTVGKYHPKYNTFLNNLAVLYFNIGEYNKAETFYFEALNNVEMVYSKYHPDYGRILGRLGLLNSEIEEYDKSILLLVDALKIIEKTLGESHSDYGVVLSNLASSYKNTGQSDKAIPLYLEALENTENSLGKNHPNYGRILGGLGLVYFETGQFEKALPLYLEALKINEKSDGKNNPSNVLALNNLGLLYVEMGQYQKALTLYDESMEIIKTSTNNKHKFYPTVINNLGLLYFKLGQYEKALPLYLEALAITENIFSTEHTQYGTSLNNLGLLYFNLGQYEKAVPLFIEALEITENIFSTEHSRYGTSLNNLASSYQSMGEYDKALNLYLKSLKKSFKINQAVYGTNLNNLASLYQDMEQYDKAIPLLLESLDISEKSFGKNHPEYGTSLNNLAFLYNNMEKYEKAFPYFKEATQNRLNNLQKNYSFLTEKEKEQYNKSVMDGFITFHSFTHQAHKKIPETIEEDFLVTMATKGLLLESNINIREAIQAQNNEQLNQLFNDWNIVNKRLDLAYSLSIEERKKRGLFLDSLKEEANLLERLVVKETSSFIDYPDYTLGKEAIAKSLQKGEVAIQFNSFQYYNKEWTDSTLYVAYILNSKGELHYIPLFEQEALKPLIEVFGESSSNVDYLAKLKAMYKLIWQPLEPYLNNANKIYYAPSGLLNKVPFYALLDSSNQYLGEQSNLHAMMSLRDLVKKDTKAKASQELIALFGGANFDFGVKKDSEEDFMNDFLMNKPLSMLLEEKNRSGWTYLKGTLKEIVQIQEIVLQSNKKSISFTGEDASEENLKATLKNKKPNILHIATHGYYIPAPEKKKEDLELASLDNEYVSKSIDEPLLRSGILLSGANRKWVHKQAIETPEDGIVSALEISRLNLQNTELVVLSACETGLGDIKHSEGVIGLQRAFKMAGAKRQIISLWQVPDKATAEMMTFFYTALLQENKDYRTAFRQAQTIMKTKYPEEPLKWAGFVLIE